MIQSVLVGVIQVLLVLVIVAVVLIAAMTDAFLTEGVQRLCVQETIH